MFRVRSGVLTVALLVGGAVPAYALDDDHAKTAADLLNACNATYNACLEACDSMGGKGFSAAFRRSTCTSDCDNAYSACRDSIPIKQQQTPRGGGRPGAVAQ